MSDKQNVEERSGKPFPIVGIGASAGGLEALKVFFEKLSQKSGMAFVVITHMSRTQPSLLPELLQKVTAIPVQTAEDHRVILPDNVYINPPNKEVTIYKGKIQLFDIVEKTTRFPIDQFLKSLAIDQGSYAAAVILSGTGSDGTSGIKEIKGCDGLVIVQNEESAAYDGMPRSAINTGLADKILQPEDMVDALRGCFTNYEEVQRKQPAGATSAQLDWLTKIFSIVRTHIGHDFSVYKSSTIQRRINRRMGLNQIESHQLYVRYLQDNPNEVKALFRELLIGVTSFFREPASFDTLRAQIIPGILANKSDEGVLRIWVPGCSTGEEVYSLAITLAECLEQTSKRIQLNIFGTDINSGAIDKARQGVYPASIGADISEERLKRFFSKEGESYRVSKAIRDCVVFSTQDIIKDPPFSRLDLLCCRNLLIYLNSKAQKKLLPLFHYTLRQDGILMLGSSETIGGFSSLFEPIDKKWKIFKRREVPQALRQMVDFPAGSSNLAASIAEPTPYVATEQQPNFARITQELILENHAPAGILIDEKGQILYIQGRTGKYLEPPTGPPTHNLIDLARDSLRFEIASALRMAKTEKTQITREKISVKFNGGDQLLDLHVRPLFSPKAVSGRFLVLFEEVVEQGEEGGSGEDPVIMSSSDLDRISLLEKELQNARESHQCTIEELESSNEELKSTNEELQSANEELQSTNEELESSKEELQSLNEEMQTVNSELQSKVDELSATHDDMRNLMNSTEIATIFVDNKLCLRRFTQESTKIINFIQSDIGRPLKHVASNLAYNRMIQDVEEVLADLVIKEVEVQTKKGKWYLMRINPYRTMDNRIAGAVITFSNIEDQKNVQAVLRQSKDESELSLELVREVFDMNRQLLAVLDQQGRIIISNSAMSKAVAMSQTEIEGADLLVVLGLDQDRSIIRQEFFEALAKEKTFKTAPIMIRIKDIEQSFTLNSRVIRKTENAPCRFLVQLIKQRNKTR